MKKLIITALLTLVATVAFARTPFMSLQERLEASPHFVGAIGTPCLSLAERLDAGIEGFCYTVVGLSNTEAGAFIGSSIVANDITIGEPDVRSAAVFAIVTVAIEADGQRFAVQIIVNALTEEITVQILQAR